MQEANTLTYWPIRKTTKKIKCEKGPCSLRYALALNIRLGMELETRVNSTLVVGS